MRPVAVEGHGEAVSPTSRRGLLEGLPEVAEAVPLRRFHLGPVVKGAACPDAGIAGGKASPMPSPKLISEKRSAALAVSPAPKGGTGIELEAGAVSGTATVLKARVAAANLITSCSCKAVHTGPRA